MHAMHIGAIDLNLVVVLRALLDERSVSRAARRLGLSQSATSHALGRLREVIQDPLFVRTRTGLVPTARAEAMASSVRASLDTLNETLFAHAPFDPSTVRRTFHVRPSDYVEYLMIPKLIERLVEVAPGVDIFARSTATEPALALEQGELDLLIQPPRTGEQTEGFHMERLWDEQFVGIARQGHPLTRGRVTLERFARAKHALVAPRGQPGGGRIDEALRERGLHRHIAYTTPSFLAAPQVIAATDLVMVLPARLAIALAGQLRLATFEPPVEIPGFEMAMFWHDRHDSDPAHAFIRGEFAHVAASLSAPTDSSRSGKRRTTDR
ncbi:LysR family transcriptional regulator [Vitiosangium sp. GDMCC 1.1324]|uniref:LysR family transcriptional regulator n=1 Tax=Vitiosangium sp. (strain GDMCC 1.1324) TaxID=2138576 RepID=UPI00130E4C55|nr:LysR family transcriptional regulator [Vitiosangium sp. GDMCC 1.1324]